MLSAAATDNHRLAYATSPVPFEITPIILPNKAALHILRVLENTNFPVDLSVTANRVRMVFGETVITTKLVDDSFPDYKRIIPTDFGVTATCVASDLARAVDTVSIVADERSNACEIHIADNVATVAMSGANNQRAEDQTEVECEGQYSIKFNSRYIMDALSRIDGDAIIGFQADPHRPAVLRDDADPDALFVVMPIRA
jgi:DNA polymerase-3 subunit beta